MPKINNPIRSKKPKQLSAKDLQDQLNKCQEQLIRAQADYSNLDKQFAQRIENRINYEKKEIFANILSILDDLERAAQHLNDSGIDMIIASFNNYLKSQGVQEISTDNQLFDPHTMECVERTGETELVIETLTKGYSLGDTVLRVARVKVGDSPSSDPKLPINNKQN